MDNTMKEKYSKLYKEKELLTMSVQDAVEFLKAMHPKLTNSAIAQVCGITPQAINNYLTKPGSKPSWTVGDHFKDLFNIKIRPLGRRNRKLSNAEIQELLNEP